MLAASRISESLQHTSITSEQVKTLISPPIYVASAPMFVYPSRLISAWEPRTIQVDLPKETKQGVEVKVAIRRGSTQSLGIDSRNILKQFYKQFTAPIDLGEEYIHDYRYETDGNIAHLLTIAAARVLFIQKTFPNIDRVTVVLRENASTMAKKVFGLLGIPVLCTDRDVKGNLVTFKETTSGSLEGFYTEFFGNLALMDISKTRQNECLFRAKANAL
ncbi:MAG: hypothetical protein HC769_21975 [Cyanobacteria bacterium CRU_2_1]|nr:hypothetical protein [Cyanobacteria bacterium CRU_2_1]